MKNSNKNVLGIEEKVEIKTPIKSKVNALKKIKRKSTNRLSSSSHNIKSIGSKVVWKDSPEERRIKATGTSITAFREEVNGFVQRLEKASVVSSNVNAFNSHNDRERRGSRAKRKIKTQESPINSHKQGIISVKKRRETIETHNRNLISIHETDVDIKPMDNKVTRQKDLQSNSRHVLFSSGKVKYHGGSNEKFVNKSFSNRTQESNVQTNKGLNTEVGDDLEFILDEMDEEKLSRHTHQEVRSIPETQPLCISPDLDTTAISMTATINSTGNCTLSQETTHAQAICVNSQLESKAKYVNASVLSNYTPESLSLTNSATFTTPEKPRLHPNLSQYQVSRNNISKGKDPFSPEFGSPLTKESWDLLNQLESQATQQLPVITSPNQNSKKISAKTNGSKGNDCPSYIINTMQEQNMVSSNLFSSKNNHRTRNHMTPNDSIQDPTMNSDTENAMDSSSVAFRGFEEDYQRYTVIYYERTDGCCELHLDLIDIKGNLLKALLLGDWYDCPVQVGSEINIIFTTTERPQRGDDGILYITIDNEQHLVVLYPDIMVSPTTVTASFKCARKAILAQSYYLTGPIHPKAFMGTLKHELFEHALLTPDVSSAILIEEANRIVNSCSMQLVETKYSENDALQELKSVIPQYLKWFTPALKTGVEIYKNASVVGKARLKEVVGTEEMMWSVKWGLKGATDASVILDCNQQRAPQADVNERVIPLELKTGSKKFSGVEHIGQTILYTLLLNERYNQQRDSGCKLELDGLLIYVPTGDNVNGLETNCITAYAPMIRGLVRARNTIAHFMTKLRNKGSAKGADVFPPVLKNPYECQRCFQVTECLLHHVAIENGTKESSGLENIDIYENTIGHLTNTDIEYFRHWNQILDLEEKFQQAQIKDPKCLVSKASAMYELKLVSDVPISKNSVNDGRRKVIFRGNNGVFSDNGDANNEHTLCHDDRILLCAVSKRKKVVRMLYVARGRVTTLSNNTIELMIFQSIPSIVTNGRSMVGKNFTWHIEKDNMLTGFNRSRENLLKLFVGSPPNEITLGIACTNQPTTSHSISLGDYQKRALIVHLDSPRFRADSIKELINARSEKTQDLSNCKHLLSALERLNVDQQEAVTRVVNAQDYTLILGMPGTGKTSTIAFCIRVLVFLGYSVLITSYTHAAVDTLLLKLIEADSKIPILRLGQRGQVHTELHKYLLDNFASTSAEVEATIMAASVVGCTCLAVNGNMIFHKRRFDVCIVDEATQITQPIVLGPLLSANSFVLVGDQYQLPPLVLSSEARGSRCNGKDGLEVSLFHRLAEVHSATAVVRLSYQYRMNGDIMTLANRLIYGGKLKAGNLSVLNNCFAENYPQKLQIIEWPYSIFYNRCGVMFLNTDTLGAFNNQEYGSGKQASGRRRMENKLEAQLISNLVEILVDSIGVSQVDIAILSPFKWQVALIRRLLPTTLSNVAVSTIDRFQGTDKEIVFVSFVRCNDKNHIGDLLLDWRRINVALTRAKTKLILIGSAKTIHVGSPLLQDMLNFAEENRWIFPPSNLQVGNTYMQVLAEVMEHVRSITNRDIDIQPEPEIFTQEKRVVSKSIILENRRVSNEIIDIESLGEMS